MAEVDPQLMITTGATAAAAWAGRRLLGPLFDEVAQDLRQRYAERRARNVLHILERAATKSGQALDEPGTVPPRMLGLLLDEGSWCEEEVMAEYWAGILAASRTPDGRDDRGTTWVKLVSRLSTFQLRTHCLLYGGMRRAAMEAPPFDIGNSTLCEEFTAVYVTKSTFAKALTIEDQVDAVLAHSLLGLRRESLIGDSLAYGPQADIEASIGVRVPEDGLVAAASWAGIDLFFWAHGYPNLLERQFTDRGLVLASSIECGAPEECSAVYRLRSNTSRGLGASERATPLASG